MQKMKTQNVQIYLQKIVFLFSVTFMVRKLKLVIIIIITAPAAL